MIVSDIEYIEVFALNEKLKYISNDIVEYLKVFENDNLDPKPLFSNDFYEVNFSTRCVKIKTNRLVLGEYILRKQSNPSEYQFKGSSEKFYWMEIIPLVSLACKNGYKIEFIMLEQFYNDNVAHFSNDDEKFRRFNYLVQYIKKLAVRR